MLVAKLIIGKAKEKPIELIAEVGKEEVEDSVRDELLSLKQWINHLFAVFSFPIQVVKLALTLVKLVKIEIFK